MLIDHSIGLIVALIIASQIDYDALVFKWWQYPMIFCIGVAAIIKTVIDATKE